MKNNLSDLNNYLFEQIERLNDDAQLTEVSANIAKLQNAKNNKLRNRKEDGKNG